MKLVVWLGNPGSQYVNTRHNIWATMLERFVSHENLWKLKYSAKFLAEVLILSAPGGNQRDEGVIFAFPQTFMNLSGNAVESLARFYQIQPAEILVLHDEIELPLGKIVIKNWWGAAGHNGLRSIISKLGSPDFQRLRIGVGKSEVIGVADFVLQKFKPNEMQILSEKESEIFDQISAFLAG